MALNYDHRVTAILAGVYCILEQNLKGQRKDLGIEGMHNVVSTLEDTHHEPDSSCIKYLFIRCGKYLKLGQVLMEFMAFMHAGWCRGS